jgi:hypothetical protein
MTPSEYRVVLYVEKRNGETIQTVASGIRLCIGKLFWTPINNDGEREHEESIELFEIRFMEQFDA